MQRIGAMPQPGLTNHQSGLKQEAVDYLSVLQLKPKWPAAIGEVGVRVCSGPSGRRCLWG